MASLAPMDEVMRHNALTELYEVRSHLDRFREWIVAGMLVLVHIFDLLMGQRPGGNEAVYGNRLLSLTC